MIKSSLQKEGYRIKAFKGFLSFLFQACLKEYVGKDGQPSDVVKKASLFSKETLLKGRSF